MDKNRGLLQLENIGYVIDNKTILDKVQFDLSAGEFKLITGPSGCGKSTLLKIISSLLSPTSGQIIFNGNDYSTIPLRNIANRFLIALKPLFIWSHCLR